MSFEIFYPYPDDKYGRGIMVECWKEEYRLVSAFGGQGQGTGTKRWGYPQNKNKKPAEKGIPWGISLGGHTQAIKMLKQILNALETTTT